MSEFRRKADTRTDCMVTSRGVGDLLFHQLRPRNQYSLLGTTARSSKRVLAIVILSVRPSLCLSVCHNPVPIQVQVR